MKPLTAELPYPCIDCLTTDLRSGQIISFAYAGLNGELTAILQYSYHKLHFAAVNEADAELLERIAIAEMTHLEILGKSMLKLGVNPLYLQYPNSNKYYVASDVSRAYTPTKMLMDDVMSELNAIAEYKKMLFVLTNEQVQAIIQRIILDEEVHLETLKGMLQKYSKTQ